MRADIQARAHKGLGSIIASHVYVGCIDDRFTLIQSGTRLYVLDMPSFTREAFFQAAVLGFGAFAPIDLNPPCPIRQLLRCVVDAPEAGWRPEDGSKEEVVGFAASLLQQHSAMLHEYFLIKIDAEGLISALPQLIPGYVPVMQLLPMFLLRLTTEVDWSAEAACLKGICRELAAFYCLRPGVAALHSQAPTHPDNVQTLGGDGSAPSFPGVDFELEVAATDGAGLGEEERALLLLEEGCCRGTCGPRLEKGDAIDAAMEAGVDDALAAAAESGIDDLVADARERRRRLHWCSQPQPTV
jgi:hypothetical protein